MMNLNELKKVLNNAQADNDNGRARYKWDVKRIDKNKINIFWSYLAKDEPFAMNVRDEKDELDYRYIFIKDAVSDETFVGLIIGDDFCADYKTIGEGIEGAAKRLVEKANYLY